MNTKKLATKDTKLWQKINIKKYYYDHEYMSFSLGTFLPNRIWPICLATELRRSTFTIPAQMTW